MIFKIITLATVIFLVSYIIFSSFIDTLNLVNSKNSNLTENVDNEFSVVISEMDLITKFPITIINTEENYVYSYLKKDNRSLKDQLKYRDELQTQIWQIFYNHPKVQEVSIIDTTGKRDIIRKDRLTTYTDIVDGFLAEDYLNNENGKGTVIPLQYTNNSDIFTHSQSIYYGRSIISLFNMKNLGYIISSVDMSDTSLYDTDALMFDSQQVFVIDKFGNIVLSNNSDTVSSDLVTSIVEKYENTALINESNYIKIDGKLYLYHIVKNNIHTITTLPVGDIVVFAINSNLMIITISSILIILLFLLSDKFIQSIIVPLAELNQETKLHVKNDFRVMEISGNDEITELTKSFNKMSTEIKYLIEEVYHKEALKADIELKMLKSQINPHFIYNTLETIRLKAKDIGDIEIEKIVFLLSKLLRQGVDSIHDKIITVQEELGILDDYVELQKIYYQDKFRFRKIVPKDLYDKKIMKLILQPLVENIIHHALFNNETVVDISVMIIEDNGNLVITVNDNGIGINQSKLKKIQKDINSEKDSKSIGLKNINRRIKLLYGNDYGLDIASEVGYGTSIKVVLPLMEYEEEGL